MGNVFRVQGTFLIMENMAMLNEKKIYKIGKNREKSWKQRGMVLTVGDDVWSAAFKIQCAFPNMERRACLNEKLKENMAEIRRE